MPQQPETDACYAENVSPNPVRNETMRPEGLRQSDRVSFRMPVEASWANGSGAETKQKAETMLVSRNGGVLRLREKLFTGQEITIRRQREGDHWKVASFTATQACANTGRGNGKSLILTSSQRPFDPITPVVSR